MSPFEMFFGERDLYLYEEEEEMLSLTKLLGNFVVTGFHSKRTTYINNQVSIFCLVFIMHCCYSVLCTE